MVYFGGERVQHFISTLKNTIEWTELLRIEFIHCPLMRNWIDNSVQVALGRKDERSMLDTMTVVERVRYLLGMWKGL